MADKNPPPSAGEQPKSSTTRIGRVPHRRSAAEPVHPTPMSSGLQRPPRPDRSRLSPSSSGGTDDGKGGKSPSDTAPVDTLRLHRRPRSRSRDKRPGEPSRLERELEAARMRTDAELVERAKYSREPLPGVRGAIPQPEEEIGVVQLAEETKALRLKFISEDDMMTRPDKYKNGAKAGKDGRKVEVTANYVALTSTWESFVVLYDVKFSPDVPMRRMRIEFVAKLLAEHNIQAPDFVYNRRNMLYLRGDTANALGKVLRKTFAHEGEKAGVTLQVTFARTFQKDDPEINQFLNNMKNEWLQTILKLSMLGRSHYDPTAVIRVQEGYTKVHLWPGFETSIADYDGGKLFNIDNRFKVIRDTSMLVVINDVFMQAQRQRASQEECRYAAAEAVVGNIVITQYSDKPRTYRVVGLDWKETIEYRFEKDGKPISLKDYFKQKYAITIKDPRQPLMLAEETGQARFKVPGEVRRTFLVPELCNPTGLTDEMRANFRLMKTMADHTLQQPEVRTQKIYDFMAKFLGHPGIQAFTNTWRLKFEHDLLSVQARVMNTVALQQGNKKFSYQLPRADWGMDLRSGRFHLQFQNAVAILFAYPRDAVRLANDFLNELKFVGGPMGWNPPECRRYEYDSDRNIVMELRQRCKDDVDLVIVMLQAKTKGRYDEIKQTLCRELPIISQCVVRKTLENQKNLRTVATKIAMQMGCKLGGAPWALDVNRFTHRGNIMYVGVDTFHDSGAKGGSRAAVAVVGTMDVGTSTQYCSRVLFQSARQEIGEELAGVVDQLLTEYHNTGKRGRFPDMILFYRDGVGSGQLKAVMENEVGAVNRVIKKRNPNAKMAFVVVTKRHNTRFMLDNGQQMENPVPGTVVDTGVTKTNRMDFYIVAQSVRQGTVSPTYYNVVYDDTALTVDELQQLTYGQCCMYFNWTGPVKVPAPCQYAHKLAFLVGQSIHDVPANELNSFLYFL